MSDQSRPLLSFCFNAESQIWEQDLWNNQIFNRVHDVIAQRTNQVFPIPEPTMDELCLRRAQSEQDALNAQSGCFNPSAPQLQQQQSRPLYQSPLTTIPLRPDDYTGLQAIYNSHYQMAYPPHQMTNLRDVGLESELFFPINTPFNRDCLTLADSRNLQEGQKQSSKTLYRRYHKSETNSPAYPDLDRTMFNNVTRAVYDSVDDRNRFILYKQ